VSVQSCPSASVKGLHPRLLASGGISLHDLRGSFCPLLLAADVTWLRLQMRPGTAWRSCPATSWASSTNRVAGPWWTPRAPSKWPGRHGCVIWLRALATATAPNRMKSGSPLPDSNRRPPLYEGGPGSQGWLRAVARAGGFEQRSSLYRLLWGGKGGGSSLRGRNSLWAVRRPGGPGRLPERRVGCG
jgi:hypothetical protein